MFEIYIIQPNDNLEEIAFKYNTSIDNLYNINNWSKNTVVVPGMSILVPANQSTWFEYYTVKSGDNLTYIANKYNTTAETIALLNGLEINSYIYPDQKLIVPKANNIVYVTKDNDTLISVSQKINYSVNEILNQNKFLYLAPNQLIVLKK